MSTNRKQSAGRVLVVDDHAAARESVADVLRHSGYEVVCASSAAEALGRLDHEHFHLLITDLQMPGMDGLQLIRNVHQRRIPIEIVMITAHATIASAVEAMRYGAFAYLEKPFDVFQLERLAAQAIERGQLLRCPDTTSDATRESEGPRSAMVGDSESMKLLQSRIAQVAPTDETVLICGESGTGKELVAREIHARSRRATGPMISLNCPALSAQLTESELFGHRRGAFTGAESDRTGRFELARGGTILLDEITEIDLPLQAKLLRVLQERTFERVGCSETRAANVRVVASTNRDLRAEVQAGNFREDLYYRLAVVPLVIPPLRDRGGDVQLLADHFLQRAAHRLNRTKYALDDDARELFATYHWPGNVRELENIITRACVLNEGDTITAAELRPWLQEPEQVDCRGESSLRVGDKLEDVEKKMILATLEHYQGHRAKTAEALGIGVRTLSSKLRSYGVAPRAKGVEESQNRKRQDVPITAAEFAGVAERKSA